MKNLLCFAIVIASSLIISASSKSIDDSDDIVGEVIWEKSNCDYYIIETKKFFVLVEWYSGTLFEGDQVQGDLHSYNFKYLKNLSRNDDEVKVWIEDYWSSKEECFEWLGKNEKCGFEEEE